ncbi:hypothetical protein Ancab_030165 [Ancistrocladus abbreviatus]
MVEMFLDEIGIGVYLQVSGLTLANSDPEKRYLASGKLARISLLLQAYECEDPIAESHSQTTSSP